MNNKWTEVWINLICHRIFNHYPLNDRVLQYNSCTDSSRLASSSIASPFNRRTSPSIASYQWTLLLLHVQGILHHAAAPRRWQFTWFEWVNPDAATIAGVHWMGMMITDLWPCRRWPHSHCARIIIIFMDQSGDQDPAKGCSMIWRYFGRKSRWWYNVKLNRS